MVVLALAALVWEVALGLAVAFTFEPGFLEAIVLERGFLDEGLAGELDAADIAIKIWKIEYGPKVFILGVSLLISGCADFYSLLIERDATRHVIQLSDKN